MRSAERVQPGRVRSAPHRTMSALAFCFAAGLVFVSGMQGQEQENREPKKSTLYQWTDERGGVHITDDPAKVPPRYHSSVRALDSYATDETPSAQAVPQPGRESSGGGAASGEDIEHRERAVWQKRISDAGKRIAVAERRLAELEKQRDVLLQAWGGPASGRVEGRVEIARMESEITTVRQELDAARRELEVEIPEEARRAGVPAGWLRE